MFIPYGRQHIKTAEVKAVVEALTSDYITQGPRVPEFEVALCARVKAAHGVAVNSATSALHIACLALGLKEGGLLWTSPNSFVASPNVGRLCSADVDFVDIDPDTFNMCANKLAEKLKKAEAKGKLPDIVMPVHFGGESCDMEAIGALSEHYGFRVIEDASHAVGGSWRGNEIGACAYSDVTVFSFHPVKIITTAEGGIAFTNNAELASRMNLYRTHGVTRDPELMEGPSDGPWYYHQVALGLNYRLTELQAALGLVQLEKLDWFLERRHEIADRYDRELSDLPLRAQKRDSDSRSALHLYIIRLDDRLTPEDRKQLFTHMRSAEIGVNVLYIPIHTQPYYRGLGFTPDDAPESVAYYERSLALPMYPDLTEAEQTRVISALKAGIAALDN